ncbi:MAG: hypothetical protein WEB62_10600 [Bacteroidota bacterium]
MFRTHPSPRGLYPPLVALFLSLVLVLVPTPVSAQVPFDAIVRSHLKQYPAMEAQDLYKLLYQAALGNEHLMTDTTGIGRYLSHELETVQSSGDEPLYDVLTPDSLLVRLHLRPFKGRNGNARLLLEAMFKTAATFHPSPENLERWWLDLERLAEKKVVPFDPGELREYFQTMRSEGFPAKHHSNTFRQLYAPAYRVLLRSLLPELIGR